MMKYSWMYRLKCLLLDKSLLFWSLLFPLILATFFQIALRPALSTNSFETIDVAVVTSSKDQNFNMVLDTISTQKNPLINVHKVDSKKDGIKLLKDETVGGVIVNKDELVVNNTNMDQIILNSFMDQYKQKEQLITQLLQTGANPEKIQTLMMKNISFVHKSSEESAQLFAVSFYTIIGMVAIMGGQWGLRSVRDLRADQSAQGARISLAPTHHLKALFSDILIVIIIQYIIMLILIAYIIFVLQVDFGDAIGYILLTTLVGSAAGISLGTLVGCYSNKKYEHNNAIVSAFTMFCSFLSGMMAVNVKYWIETNIPLLARINPVNMITDALYSIYYYGGGNRFWLNLGALCIFTIICFTLSYIKLARKKYASL